MKSYHKNPRTITTKQFADLAEWLSELGDLSPIVHNLETDEVISGNQRMRVFDINRCEIVHTVEFDEADEQGTVALGYIIWHRNKYAYRAVRWTSEQAAKANVVANRAGGMWDWDVLANEFEVDDLLEWGFSEIELQIDALAAGAASTPANGADNSNGDGADAGYYELIVECESERVRVELASRLGGEGYACRMGAIATATAVDNDSLALVDFS